MKKIVLLSQPGQVNLEFIAMLTAVFPECDILIAAADRQDSEKCSPGPFSKPDMTGEQGT
jgi:hypothetical protein